MVLGGSTGMELRTQHSRVLDIVAATVQEEGIDPREYHHNSLTSQGLKAQSPKVSLRHNGRHSSRHGDMSSSRHSAGHSSRHGDGHVV
eukprot:3955636-Ditylum_brightwellii.AAC.1